MAIEDYRAKTATTTTNTRTTATQEVGKIIQQSTPSRNPWLEKILTIDKNNMSENKITSTQ